jgi:hypothetical protein
MQGAYWHGWRRSGCLDAKTRVLAVGVLASTTCNNFIADLLFLSDVPHPYLGKSALRHDLGSKRPAAAAQRAARKPARTARAASRELLGELGAGSTPQPTSQAHQSQGQPGGADGAVGTGCTGEGAGTGAERRIERERVGGHRCLKLNTCACYGGRSSTRVLTSCLWPYCASVMS